MYKHKLYIELWNEVLIVWVCKLVEIIHKDTSCPLFWGIIILEKKEEFYKGSLKCQYLYSVLDSLIYNTLSRPLGRIIEVAKSKYVEYKELTNLKQC